MSDPDREASAPQGRTAPECDRIAALLGGVAPAQALLAGMQLGVFAALDTRTMASAEIARAIGVSAPRLDRLLHALVAIGLLEKTAGGFRNGREAADRLVPGRPRHVGALHDLLAELWAADMYTAKSIQTGLPAAAHDFAEADAAGTMRFFRGLAASARAFGAALAQAEDFAGATKVVDIGGGPGGAALALRERWPHLAVTVLELPSSVGAARALLAEQGAAGTVAVVAGDIVAHPTAELHDAAILKALLQVLSPEQAARAIANTAASLAPGGRIFISGSGILDDDRLGPPEAVLINLTFLNLYSHGASHTEAEYRDWLSAAGFGDIRRARLPTGSDLISATKTG